MVDHNALKSIEDLHRLKNEGVITEEDYEKAKERLLFGAKPPPAPGMAGPASTFAAALRTGPVPMPADDDHFGWITLAVRRFADFEGRSSRQEFWMFQLIYVGIVAVMFGGGLDMVGGTGALGGLMFALAILALLALTVPQIAVQVRRLHDQDKSGWLALINFIPYVGAIVVFVLMLMEGTKGDNRFGPDPTVRP